MRVPVLSMTLMPALSEAFPLCILDLFNPSRYIRGRVASESLSHGSVDEQEAALRRPVRGGQGHNGKAQGLWAEYRCWLLM